MPILNSLTVVGQPNHGRVVTMKGVCDGTLERSVKVLRSFGTDPHPMGAGETDQPLENTSYTMSGSHT